MQTGSIRVLDIRGRYVHIIFVNIDERLEALTHSVELLASMQIATEKRLQLLIDSTARVAAAIRDHEERLDNLEGRRPQ
jgi:hypothetical protein